MTASHKRAELDALTALPTRTRQILAALLPARMKTQELPQSTARLWESIFA
jgi:hypothetical protein